MPNSRSSLPFMHRSVTSSLTTFLTVPFARALANNSLEPKDTKLLFLGENFANFRPLGSALIAALAISICDKKNFFSAFKDIFDLAILHYVFLAGWLLPHRSETARVGGLATAALAPAAPLRVSLNLSSPRLSSMRWRRPHFCIVVTGASQHISQLPFSWR